MTRRRPQAPAVAPERVRIARPTLASETLVLGVSVFLAVAANGPFWSAALAGRNAAAPQTWIFVLLAFVLLVALHFAAIASVAPRRVLRPLLAALLVISALASHFMRRYGVVLDPTMLRNVLHTDPREASELIGASMMVGVAVLGVIPAVLVCRVQVRRRPLRRALAIRLGAIAVALAVAAAALLLAFQDLGSLMRNRRELRYAITPGNVVYSLGRALAGDVEAAATRREPPEPASRAAAPGRRPTLFLMVVGETARAANFSINGYPRPTTPELARLDIVNFPRTTACGTSTEVSLPCMFSPFGRADYDERRIRRHESLLHLLARAGMKVIWRDNQSGCKGVCDGLEMHDVSRAALPGVCGQGHCLDEVLLHGLEAVARDASSDLVVVLHQIGNHGPAYHRRYPADAERFAPACRHDDLRECTREEIVNAYDNAIAYTDGFLAQAIRFLGAQRARFDVAMLYVSDHGESLGERGLYLHGMPHAIAPREQLEVPMLWWIPPDAARGLRVDLDCLRRRAAEPASHDHLFHSILGVLDVGTPRYRPERDLFGKCRLSS